MKLEKALFDRSYLWFILFLAVVLFAFWFTYFTRILDQENYRMHVHGLVLFSWCLMLILQAWLIRSKRRSLHKQIGKLSYVLVPLLLYTTTDLLRYKLSGLPSLGTMDYFFVALVMVALLVFAILYGLAIYYRKQPGLHARFMLCTIFPMFTPATDRIIYVYIDPLVKYLPTIEGNPVAPVAGFLLADLILVGLSFWDWKSHRSLRVFPMALALLLFYDYAVLNFYKFQFWKAFSYWLVG